MKSKTCLNIRLAYVLILLMLVVIPLSMTTPAYAVTTQQKVVLDNFQDALTSIIDQVLPSVVSITSERKAKPQPTAPEGSPEDDFFKGFPFPMPSPDREAPESRGTGVIVRPDGYILTNDHVVGGADKVTVTLKDGRTFDGTVLRDQKGDLALVKIKAEGLPAAKLGDSDKLKVGSFAIAVGSPFGYDQTVTFGIVSGIGRQAGVSDGNTSRYYPNLIQTDASINPGNSGGPLMNIDGEVIGINTLIRSNYGGGNIGIGFAIPANTAKFVMDQLISSGKVLRGYLGIQPDDLTPEQKATYGVAEGALVRTVEEGSPADKAGLQVEDIIIDINGIKITGQLKLRDVVAAIKPGTEIPVTIVRDKQKKNLKITLQEDPLLAAANETSNASIDKLGFNVSTITPDIIEKYKLDPKSIGIVVTAVTNGSNAMKAGLQPGLVITKANDKPVKTQADFDIVTKDMKSGDSLRLVVKTKERTILLSYKLD
ncbi:MAG: Do family serine endopeptidase [Armatimonadota bacterium]